jgi:LPXTG-site transpeptidase (sortase) family protein
MAKRSARTSGKSKPKLNVETPKVSSSKRKLGLNFKKFPRVKLNPKIKALFALILFLIGFLLFNTYVNIHFPKTNLTFNSPSKKTATIAQTGSIHVDPSLMKVGNVSEEPIRIVIPSTNIDLNVIEAEVKDGYWETSETTASHGMGSANPGQNGNSVIFAHARVGLFYNLKDLKKDDIVYVFTQKKWYPYKVTDITSVYPDQVEVIAPTKDQTLTLYTCTGYADEKRLIVVAKPLKQG